MEGEGKGGREGRKKNERKEGRKREGREGCRVFGLAPQAFLKAVGSPASFPLKFPILLNVVESVLQSKNLD